MRASRPPAARTSPPSRPLLRTCVEAAADPGMERVAQRGETGVEAADACRVNGAGVAAAEPTPEAVREAAACAAEAPGVAGVAGDADASDFAAAPSAERAPESEGTTPLVSISLKWAMGTVRRQQGHQMWCVCGLDQGKGGGGRARRE